MVLVTSDAHFLGLGWYPNDKSLDGHQSIRGFPLWDGFITSQRWWNPLSGPWPAMISGPTPGEASKLCGPQQPLLPESGLRAGPLLELDDGNIDWG